MLYKHRNEIGERQQQTGGGTPRRIRKHFIMYRTEEETHVARDGGRVRNETTCCAHRRTVVCDKIGLSACLRCCLLLFIFCKNRFRNDSRISRNLES